MRKIMAAAGYLAIIFAVGPAAARDYPYCLQGRDYALPGLMSIQQLRAMPSDSLRNFFILRYEPAFCIRMAAAGPALLSGLVVSHFRRICNESPIRRGPRRRRENSHARKITC